MGKKARPLTQIAVNSTLEAEDAVANLLERIFGQTPAIYTNAETGNSVITVYSEKQSSLLRAKKDHVTKGLLELVSIGLKIGEGTVLVKAVPREDWSESWKKFFKTIEIGSALLVRPSWSRQKAKAGQAVVVLDPGLSFGTGQHPTTHFCLSQLVALRKKARSFLDMGMGTGILSIAATKLGYKPVNGFDFDPVAVRVAKANARRNRVEKQVHFSRQDLTKLPQESRTKADLICANLISDLLVGQASKIVSNCRIGCYIVLAGILTRQFGEVQAAFEKQGCKFLETKIEGEWQSGLFQREES